MNIIMNKNMKKRMDSAIDLYWFANGNGGQTRCTRIGGVVGGGSTKYLADVYGSYRRQTWPNGKNRISAFKTVYRIIYTSVFQRKFSKILISYKSSNTVIFTDTIDMVSGTVWDTRFSTDSGTTRYRITSTVKATNVISLAGVVATSFGGNNETDSTYPASINYPILTKTVYKNGIAYNQAKVTGTADGNVRVSLIAPFDVQATQTGVNIDSFQIEFFDDFDRPTAIVTGTIGDLNSTADVKMANTLIEDGAYINISGMDDFLITTPNTIAISN